MLFATSTMVDASSSSISIKEGQKAAVVTTLPSEFEVGLSEGGDFPEYQALAEAKGITVDQARQFFQNQAEAIAVIEQVRDRPEYVDFMFTDDGMGRLLVEPTVDLSSPFGDVEILPNIEVAHAALDEMVRVDMVTRMGEVGRQVLGEQFVGVHYDAFSNEFVVSVKEATIEVSSIEANLVESFATELRSARSTVSISVVEPTVDARGGQTATTPSTKCTTGFGLAVGPYSGYLTAGHCNTGQWTINGIHESVDVIGKKVNGYQDRMVIMAPGASWLVRISPRTEVDMSSSFGHIYRGAVFCHFGQSSDELRCDAVWQVNVAHNTGAGNRWTSRSHSNCQGGDSGGPVWFPTAPDQHIPVGIISGYVNSNGDCLYVSLDDQLSGTQWKLL